MADKTNLIQNFVAVSQFNMGQASKIFARLDNEKEIVVLKNNNSVAVILSPDEYLRLKDIEQKNDGIRQDYKNADIRKYQTISNVAAE